MISTVGFSHFFTYLAKIIVLLTYKRRPLPHSFPARNDIFYISNNFMFTNVWVKYLPVLRIVLKRSLAAEQQFALNAPDFERAGHKRKSGYKFLIKLKDGRLSNVIVDAPVASSLATTLLEDKVIREMIDEKEFHISMNTKYQLTIKHIPHHKEQLQPAAVEEAQ